MRIEGSVRAGTHFTDAETAHLSSIIEAVTTALRRCQANTFLVRPMREPRRLGPVVLLLSPELQVLGQTPETHEYLRVLVPPVDRRAPIPASAYNVAAQLLAVEAEVDRNPPSARVHLSEGLWVSLRAARIGDAEPSPWHLTLITQPCAPPRRHRCHRPLRHEITKSGCRTNVGGVQGHPSVPSLIAECRRPGLPGIVPSARFSLAAVPELVLAELARCRRGVVVLGVDGLSHAAAARCWPSAELTCLTSTFPSTSATAWLTALTGCGPRVHGVPGMVYRVGATMVYAVTGEGIAGEPVVPAGAVVPQPTVFERAGAAGARCLALGRELVHLPGTWAPALLRGTTRAAAARTPGGPAAVAWTSAELAAQAADPGSLVDAVAAEVTAVLAGTGGSADGAPTLLWVYVNADDYVHANGYDRRLLAALRRLDGAAREWAAGGWTVAAHSDHGQVPVRSDPALAQAWARVDDPRECELPGGGAGRVRWLHPRPGREDEVRARLADALGDAAVVLAARDLDLPPGLRLPLDRVGAVVAIAASERFPLPNPELRYEHGGLDVEEMLIPLATWRSR